MKNPILRKAIALLTGFCLLFSQCVQITQAVTLGTAPLATSTASAVLPNIMYVLDDSGSMAWNYLPDYVDAASASLDPTGVPSANTTAWGMCWGVSGGLPTDTPNAISCTNHTEMPFSTGNINYLAYDPTIRYQPPVYANGSSYSNSSPTAAHSDGFAATGSSNLTTSTSHQVWCNSTSATPTAADPTGGGKCVENLDTTNNNLYPDATHVILKTYNGVPFYFTMSPTEYCTDFTLTNCVRSTVSTTIAGVTFNVPSYYRWCHDYIVSSHTFSGCQGTRDPNHIIPNYLGGWTASGGSAGSPASAALVVQSCTNGQSINSITIAGTEVLGTTVAPANGASVTSIAQTLCTDIKSHSALTGYTCPTAPTTGALTLQTLTVGTAVNGQQVLVSGPPATAAVNSVGRIVVTNPPTAGYTITGITVNGNSLINSTVTSDGTSSGTAVAICNAIQSGPNQSIYQAYSGDVDLTTVPPTDSRWGTCNATVNGWVEIIRVPADTTDNGQAIVITGPPPASQYVGTITVVSTTGATRIDDIKLAGTSLLTSKPLTYTDGTQTATIASDIASKISHAGCTAAAAGGIVTITGSVSCNGTIAVTANGLPATATFRVSSSGQANMGGDLGGIQVGSTTIVGHIPNTTITDSTNVSANATTLAAAATASGWSAGSVASGSPLGTTYDVTVTAPPPDNQYNNLSFSFLHGTAVGSVAATAPQWTFPITGATADNANLTSITCGGTTAVSARNTGTSSGANVNWVQNLSNGFNGQTVNSYSYACSALTSPAYNCTVTGPAGAAACASLTINPTAGISITNHGQTQAGASPPSWNLSLNADSDVSINAQNVSNLTCGATSTLATAATTGAGSNVHYVNNLATGLATNGANGYAYALTGTTNLDGPQQVTVTGPYTSGTFCTTGLSITNTGATLSTITPAKSTAGAAASAGTAASYPVTVSLVSGGVNNAKINTLTCPGSTGSPFTFTTKPSTGTVTGYATALANSMNSLRDTSDWSPSATPCTGNDAAGTVACTFKKDSTACGTNPVITFSPSSGGSALTSTAPTKPAASGNMTFTISNANTTNQTVTGLSCTENQCSSSYGLDYAQATANAFGSTLIGNLSSTYWNAGSSSCTSTLQSGRYSSVCTLVPKNPSTCYSFTPAFSSPGGSGTAVSVGSVGGNHTSGYTITFSNIPADGSIAAVKCNGTSTSSAVDLSSTYCNIQQVNAIDGTASTGAGSSSAVQYLNNLNSTLNNSTVSSGSGYQFTGCTVNAGVPNLACSLTGPIPSGAAPTCTLGTDASINGGGAMTATAGAAATAGSAPQWQFNINSAASGNTIGPITCTGSGMNTLTAPASAGSATILTEAQRLTNLANSLVAHEASGWSYAVNTTGKPSTLTLTGPTANSGQTCTWSGVDNALTLATPTVASAGSAGPPKWSFDLTNATADSLTFGTVACGGTSLLPTPVPNTGTSPASTDYIRINNLSNAPSTLTSNNYTLSCQTATATTPSPSCTLNGPPGVAACTNLVYTKDASISIGASTRTNAGSAGSNGTVDFSQYLSQISAFSGGYLGQSTSVTPIQILNTGTIATTTLNMTNGTPLSPLTIATNATGTSPNILVMSGGNAPTSANNWLNVGIFHRTDIISTTTSYNRASTRTDCAGVTCTYTEELQNYANWYSYYSIRMLMAKTASTLAFSNLGNTYRVGFDDICNCDGKTCATTVQEPVAQFSDTGEVANQRTTWWNKLTTSNPSCGTPLRGVTAKIGRYYAHKLSTASTDPMQYSCQQNFMFLVTDGFWNESENTNIVNLSGADIGNQDNNIATSPRPFYDGQMPSTTCPSIGSNRGSNASSCRNLSDIAWYYYSNDLRTSALGNATNTSTGVDVSANNVLTSPNDMNSAQHMVFYAMGLGVDGYLNYRQDYLTAGVGDYANIIAGTQNWPAVKNLDPTGIDDLWHATVNGHGQYFSARNPSSVVTDLTQVLSQIGARVGAASAAATSNLQPVTGDNYAYVASYFTGDWSGDLQARTIDLTSGAVSSSATWSAQAILDQTAWATRNIYIAPTSNASGDPLRAFNYTNLTATEQSYFNPGSAPVLSQYATLSVSNPNDIVASNLVNYLSGDRSLEQDGNTAAHPQIWRKRGHVLGDIDDTQPVYVKAPNFGYTDTGYAAFISGNASRKPVIFVSAQDGMLHAFNAYTSNILVSGSPVQPGGEMWAYIPKLAMANNLKLLADASYTHQFYIDGQITVGDVFFSGAWHTILVAGLAGGGKGYIALDITDPTNPLYLWEITSTSAGFSNLGYTYGNASINKLPGGNWAVMFSSGYNTADGSGHLFAVDAGTGAMLSGFPLNTTSSNLSNASFVVNNTITDNTAQFGYAGDLNGNLWRFDLAPTALGHTGVGVYQLAHLQNASGTAQPITTLPLVTILNNGTSVVYVGTGQYLGTPDLSTTQVQSLYAIKDTRSSTGTCSTGTCIPRTDASFLVRNLIGDIMNNPANPITTTVAGVTSNSRQICSGASSEITAAGACTNESGPSMDWTLYNGWYVDFPVSGERMNVNMNLSLGTITFATNIPASSACTSGGSAWLNYIDYQTGLAVANTTSQVSTQVSNSLIVGITVVKLPTNALSTIVTTSNNQQLSVPTSFQPTTFAGKRSQWREFEIYH